MAQTQTPTPTGLVDLPYTLFAEIVAYLPSTDVLICRRVSQGIRQALMRQDLCVTLILAHFPRSQEGRQLRRLLAAHPDATGPDAVDELDRRDWAAVFALLSRRYAHLSAARPWRTQKLRTLKDPERLRAVTPWNRFLRLDKKTAPFHYWEPAWTLSAADGILVYPAGQPGAAAELSPPYPYRARDLDSGAEVGVPFDVEGKVVRRVRLSGGVLIFEWRDCEVFSSSGGIAYRHFVTAFDITRSPKGPEDGLPLRGATNGPDSPSRNKGVGGRCGGTQSPWTVTFRSEWKIHHLGSPLSHQDRFYSTHNATHYVVYIWQPPRLPWGETEPLEQLTVWELGEPTSYQPSLDPSGLGTHGAKGNGPRVVRWLTNDDLRHWGVRQGNTPSLMGLALDTRTWDSRGNACGHVFVHEEDHRWLAGPHSGADPPRLHRVRSTGIPLMGDGPRWLDDCGSSSDQDDDGGARSSFCWRGPRQKRRRIAGGSRTVGSNGLVEEEVEEVEEGTLDVWAGRAPCWRHDDFPYLTVSEMYDAAAGVRISARHCFMLETLSVNVRPKLRVEGVGAFQDQGGWARREREREWRVVRRGSGGGGSKVEGPDGDEVQFSDGMWRELLGRGCIAGGERWLVGEDGQADITILHF